MSIPIKAKKCKPTGKAKNYESCGEVKIPFRYGMCRKCYLNWLLTTKEGKEQLDRCKIAAKRKEKTRREVEECKKLKAMKEDLTDYKKKLQTKINQIVRLIDKGQPCLALQKHPKQVHAGHVYSRGANQSMRFNLHNIHRQSAQSNHFQNDDLKMREGLIREYGERYAEFVYELKQTPSLKYTNITYKEFYEKACLIALELKKKDRVYDKCQRIDLRNKFNTRIGIYRLKQSYYNQFKIVEQ